MTVSDCVVCRKHAGELPPPGGPLLEDELLYASHVFDVDGTGRPSYLGHLIVEPRRHVGGLDGLTPDEASDIGRTVATLARALIASERAEHVYSAVIGHRKPPHLHVHVFPRYPGTPEEFWFARVDEWPDAPKGGPAEIAEAVERLRRVL